METMDIPEQKMAMAAIIISMKSFTDPVAMQSISDAALARKKELELKLDDPVKLLLNQAETILENMNDGAVKFLCPDCGSVRLECVVDETIDSEILSIDKDGNFEYDSDPAGEECTRFGCHMCNFDITDEDGQCITNDEELIEWLKKNCNQE